MKTELERFKVLSALKLGYGKLTAKNTSEAEFKNIEDAIEIVKNCHIPDVAQKGTFCECEAPLVRTGNNSNEYCGICGKDIN